MSLSCLFRQLVLFIAIACLSGCASVQLGTVPPPKDTAQLRVALYAVSGLIPNGSWGSSEEEFRRWHYRTMGRMLKNYGAYQVVGDKQVQSVLGEQELSPWQLSRNNWELGFELGKALHADYLLVSVRGTMGEPHYYFETVLLNIATGAKYAVRINNTRTPNTPRLPQGTAQMAYRELFADAKSDLLSTALRKSRQMMADTNGDEQARKTLAETRAAEQRAFEQSEQARRAAEKAAAEQAAAERLVRERKEQERRAAEELARVNLLKKEKHLQEERAQRKAEQARRAAERQAREKAEAARLAEEKAARDRAETERLAALKLEQEQRLAVEADQAKKAEARKRRAEEARREIERAKAAAEKSLTQAPRQVQFKDAEQSQGSTNGRKKLIVYDISTTDSLQVVGLILSEALREEILRRGTFNIVNRENLSQLFDELKFQQSGPVDPSQAVKLGKGAGASEIITSNLGSIGKILMLQSKRVEVESMLNLSAASLKGQPGHEDELLKELPGLVDRLLYGK